VQTKRAQVALTNDSLTCDDYNVLKARNEIAQRAGVEKDQVTTECQAGTGSLDSPQVAETSLTLVFKFSAEPTNEVSSSEIASSTAKGFDISQDEVTVEDIDTQDNDSGERGAAALLSFATAAVTLIIQW